jgi:putative MATE family efflux protein
MKSLWIANLLNIILCPVCIYLYGLKGAAIATVVGRSGGVLYQCYHLFRGRGMVKLKPRHFAIEGELFRSIIKIASPATLQFLITSGSWIILARVVAETGGTTATAGYQIAIRNFIFFLLPVWGLSNAAATLVGQNLGAKNALRAEQSAYKTAKFSMIIMGTIMFVFVLFPNAIIRLYTNDESVIHYGALALRWFGSGNVFYGLSMVMIQSLNGAGDTRTPTLINFFCFWLFQIPLAYLLAYSFHLKSTGAFIAVPVAEIALALSAWLYFRKGKWKNISV